ncbi:MAG: choice-of-anchor Q domain-containing protein [Betaproteobacteria bacterium]
MNAAAGSNAMLFENVTSARNFGANPALLVTSGATPSGTVTVRNTIMGSGTAGLGFASASLPAIGGVTYAIANSIVENSSTGVLAGACGVNGNLCNVDAKLENLALNGIATTRTHALRPGSPALDAGDNTGVAANDQRGAGYRRTGGSSRTGIFA